MLGLPAVDFGKIRESWFPSVSDEVFEERVTEISRIAVRALLPFVAALLCLALFPPIINAYVLAPIVIGVTFLSAFLYLPDPNPSENQPLVLFPVLRLPRIKNFKWAYNEQSQIPNPGASPVGIDRKGSMNCSLIALMQILRRVDPLWSYLSNPSRDRPIEGLEGVALFVQRYNEASSQGRSTVSGDTTSIRLSLSLLNPDEISLSSSQQEDVVAALDLVMNHPSVKEFVSADLIKMTQYEQPNNAPRVLNLLTTKQESSWGLVPVSLEKTEQPQSLQQLVDGFFTERPTDLSVELDTVKGGKARCLANKISYLFRKPPEKIWIQVKRFTHSDSEGVISKNSSLIVADQEILIPTSGGHKSYRLDSFIIHQGDSLSSGHYVACVGDYLCDDKEITQITQEQKQHLASQAYLLLYSPQ